MLPEGDVTYLRLGSSAADFVWYHVVYALARQLLYLHVCNGYWPSVCFVCWNCVVRRIVGIVAYVLAIPALGLLVVANELQVDIERFQHHVHRERLLQSA